MSFKNIDQDTRTTASPTFAQVTATGRIISDDATDATTGTDGSVQTDGGISAVKNIYTDEYVSTATAKGLKVAGTVVVTDQQTALTTQLTTVTATAPGTPDYAIQDLTTTTPYGFVTADEAQTVLSVIANLQTRMAELETKLKAHGLIA